MDDMAILSKFGDTGSEHGPSNSAPPVRQDSQSRLPDAHTHWRARLQTAFKTDNADVATTFMLQALNSVAMTEAGKSRTVDYVVASIGEIEPKNSIEAMLAAQMVSVYLQSMEMMRLGSRCTFSETCRQYLSLANQLMRLYLHQAETLRKLRNNGRQQIRVEHVNISGGQNIVGTVTHSNERGPGV